MFGELGARTSNWTHFDLASLEELPTPTNLHLVEIFLTSDRFRAGNFLLLHSSGASGIVTQELMD